MNTYPCNKLGASLVLLVKEAQVSHGGYVGDHDKLLVLKANNNSLMERVDYKYLPAKWLVYIRVGH